MISLLLLCSSALVKSQATLPAFPGSGQVTVRFYPNPATSVITFDMQKVYPKDYSIQVFNFLGKKVAEFSAGDPKTPLQLTDYFRGIYIFQLKDNTGKVLETGKFQVNK